MAVWIPMAQSFRLTSFPCFSLIVGDRFLAFAAVDDVVEFLREWTHSRPEWPSVESFKHTARRVLSRPPADSLLPATSHRGAVRRFSLIFFHRHLHSTTLCGQLEGESFPVYVRAVAHPKAGWTTKVGVHRGHLLREWLSRAQLRYLWVRRGGLWKTSGPLKIFPFSSIYLLDFVICKSVASHALVNLHSQLYL